MVYTRKQREWFLEVYEHKCQFPVYNEREGWHRCGSDIGLQLHHVIPQRWYKEYLKKEDPDTPLNGIILCITHHLGKGLTNLNWREDYVPCIHPDIEWDRTHYRGKDELGLTSYDNVFTGRAGRVKHGDTYWNTDFDKSLEDIVQETVWKYMVLHKDKPFPYRRKQNGYKS